MKHESMNFDPKKFAEWVEEEHIARQKMEEAAKKLGQTGVKFDKLLDLDKDGSLKGKDEGESDARLPGKG